jgi:hypothetical protein
MKAMMIIFGVLISLAIGVRALPRTPGREPAATFAQTAPAAAKKAAPTESPVSHLLDAEPPSQRELGVSPEYQQLHQFYARRFTDAMGFGADRIESIVEFHYITDTGMKEPRGTLNVNRVELMGLAQAPVIYTSEAVPVTDLESAAADKFKIEFLSEVKPTLPVPSWKRNPATRAMDEFEKAAVKRMQDGRDIVVRNTGKGVQLIGALRAQENCAKCHDTARGALLGALVYSMERNKPE